MPGIWAHCVEIKKKLNISSITIKHLPQVLTVAI